MYVLSSFVGRQKSDQFLEKKSLSKTEIIKNVKKKSLDNK